MQNTISPGEIADLIDSARMDHGEMQQLLAAARAAGAGTAAAALVEDWSCFCDACTIARLEATLNEAHDRMVAALNHPQWSGAEPGGVRRACETIEAYWEWLEPDEPQPPPVAVYCGCGETLRAHSDVREIRCSCGVVFIRVPTAGAGWTGEGIWDHPPPCTCGEPHPQATTQTAGPTYMLWCEECYRQINGPDRAVVAQAWAAGRGNKGEVLRVE